MASLRVLSGREVCRILERQGFTLVRRPRGSHIIMRYRAPDGGVTTVPVPDHRELRPGTLQTIIRQSGLPRTLFEEKS